MYLFQCHTMGGAYEETWVQAEDYVDAAILAVEKLKMKPDGKSELIIRSIVDMDELTKE